MNAIWNRLSGLAVAMLLLMGGGAPMAASGQEAELHPLQIHMQQWLRGSGQWRTPSPNYDPDYSGPPAPASVEYYGINWHWNANLRFMQGELTGIFADGTEVEFWSLFAFYNPITERVIHLQTGRNSAYMYGESPVLTEPLAFGELERQESTIYWPDGRITYTRHENVFHEDGTHTSKAYERGENGEWELQQEYLWRLTSLEGETSDDN